LWTTYKEKIVVCEDLLYCKFVEGVAVFNLQNGKYGIVCFPFENAETRGMPREDIIFSCGSRVLLELSVLKADMVFRGFLITEIVKPKWDLDKSVGLRFIAIMPPTVLQTFRTEKLTSKYVFILRRFGSLMFDFEGTGDLVCLRHACAKEVLVYNTTQKTWKWLPTGPIPDGRQFSPAIFSFEPRPHNKFG